MKSFRAQAFVQHHIYFAGRHVHLVLGGVSPGFAVASIWISRGSCPGSRVTSMKAFISSPSLLSCSSTWAASPTPSRLGACLGMLQTTTRLSPRREGHVGLGTASRDGMGQGGMGRVGMSFTHLVPCQALMLGMEILCQVRLGVLKYLQDGKTHLNGNARSKGTRSQQSYMGPSRSP